MVDFTTPFSIDSIHVEIFGFIPPTYKPAQFGFKLKFNHFFVLFKYSGLGFLKIRFHSLIGIVRIDVVDFLKNFMFSNFY